MTNFIMDQRSTGSNVVWIKCHDPVMTGSHVTWIKTDGALKNKSNCMLLINCMERKGNFKMNLK